MTYVSRERAVAKLRAFLMREQHPRLEMTCILILTGLAGFLSSVALLQFGMNAMWIRYPLSAILAYGVFLGCVRYLVRCYRVRAATQLSGDENTCPTSTPPDDGHIDLSDLPDAVPDSDEGCAVFMAIIALLALATVALYFIVTAPTLLAELVLDSFVVTGLYRAIRDRGEGEWFMDAIARTAIPALVLVIVLCLAGAAFETYAPKADSLSDVIEKWSAGH